jgi:hypothetical protein
MAALKETNNFALLTAIKTMLGRWALKIKELHVLATAGPYRCTEGTRDAFEEELKKEEVFARTDFERFVKPMAPPNDNTAIAVVIRLFFKQYVRVLFRFRDLYYRCIAANEPDWTFMLAYMTPEETYYHYKNLPTMADVPHYLFIKGTAQHLLLMSASQERPRAIPTPVSVSVDDMSMTDMSILYDNKTFDDVLNYMCYFGSFPVVPVDVTGILRPSLAAHRPYMEIPLMEPGIENRRRVTNGHTERVCIRCKTINQAIGQSDINEQAKRSVCQCVTRETVYGTDCIVGNRDIRPYYLESAITTRATMITRMNAYYGGGCKCETHRQIFYQKFKEYTDVISAYSDGEKMVKKQK